MNGSPDASLHPVLMSSILTPSRLPVLLALAALPAVLPAQATSCRADGAGVMPGVEVLLRDSLHLLRGKRVGLITNHTGRDRRGTSSIDLLHRAPGVRLTALYGPEHGLRGVARGGAHIASTVDSATGIPVHVVQGRRDPFGDPAEVTAVLPPGATLDVVPGTHSLGGAATGVAAAVLARLGAPMSAAMRSEVGAAGE